MRSEPLVIPHFRPSCMGYTRSMPCAFRVRVPRLAPLAILAGALCCVSTLSAQYGPVDPFESSVRALKEGIAARADGEQHAAMVALRELRDPALRPLLERLLKSDDWSLRVDSVLGLAELDPAGKVDVALVESLPGEGDRETSINAVVALELLDSDRVAAMLAWDDVPAAQRILLACEQRRLGGTPDIAGVLRLADSKTPEIAALAAALLIEIGPPAFGAPEAAALAERTRTTIASLPPRSRSAIVAQVADACSISRLKGAAPFVVSLLALPDIGSDARMRALGALLVLSPEAAFPVLAAAIDADRSQTGLMRHASILLASGVRAPKSEWDRRRKGDALIEALADAGTAIGESRDDDAYARILALKHRVALRAALEGARRLGSSSDRALGIACAKYLVAERRSAGALAEGLTRAMARLAVVAPEELRPILEAVTDDRAIQEAVLLALASAGSLEASSVAKSATGKSSRIGEAMIAVLNARFAEKLAQSELDQLATVAGGGAGVPPAVRTQAAWLWLRHAKRTEPAIDALLAGNSPATPASNATTAPKEAAQ